MDAPPAILEAFQACRKSFGECVGITALMHQEWAENRLADFSLWGAGIGASASGRASLDSRLALKPTARDVIVNLLRILKTLVEECHDLGLSIAHGTTPQRGGPRVDENVRGRTDALEVTQPSKRSFSPWSDESSSDSHSEPDVEAFASNNDLSEAMKSTEEILDQLIKIAVAIRRSGTRARLQKADQLFRDDDYSNLRSHLNVVVLSHAEFSEDQIDPRRLTKVQQRLINCNLKRRNRFIYAQKHSKRLNPNLLNSAFAIDLGDERPSDPKAQPAQLYVVGKSSDAEVLSATSPRKTGMVPGGTVTTATVVSSTLTLRPGTVPSQAATTQVSSTGSRLSYPNPPKIKEGACVFKCPCCCQTLPSMMAEGGRWRKHIVGDLSPYTCVLDYCPKPEILYTTKDAWKKHLLEDHRSAQYWVCFACGEAEQFLDEDAFVFHTRKNHHETVSQDQIQILTTVCRRSIPLEINSCPLCNFAAAQNGVVCRDAVIDHIAEHVHSFSLRALPWAPDDEDENEQLINHSVRRVREWTARLDGSEEDFQDNEKYPVFDKPGKPRDLDNYFDSNQYFGDSSGRDTLSQISGYSSKERYLESLREEGSLIFSDISEVGEVLESVELTYDSKRSLTPPVPGYSLPERYAAPDVAGDNQHFPQQVLSRPPYIYPLLPAVTLEDTQRVTKEEVTPDISHFPKLRDPGPNVPPSHFDKREVIEKARTPALHCGDPEMQLAWAQDALYWVEIDAVVAIRAKEATGEPLNPITPQIEYQIRVDAINIVLFLAEQLHPKADFMRSMWLEFGKFGYQIDKREAFLGYRRSAKRGYGRSEYRIGMQYESSNDPTKAIQHYEAGVAMGDSAARYRLGMMMLLGQHGTSQDYRKGLDLILAAAATADENAPQGAYVYGMLLAKEVPNLDIPEEYLPVNLEQARVYVEKAAFLGFAKAQLKMGQAYELCELECKFDPALSMHYYALAAWQGEAEADFALSKWFLCGSEGIFMQNEELAFTYAKRAAAILPSAQFAMGYFYEVGVHVHVDLKEAVVWYQKAVDGGNKDAVARLGEIIGDQG